MELEILYKRNKAGEIQYWKISYEIAAFSDNPSRITKESGRLGTDKPLTHVEVVSVGKQKRNPSEQAQSQAESDWRKKRDEGYKSLKDLGIVDHGTYVSHAGQDLCLEEMLDTVLPQFNTDASGQAKPMLAKAVDWNKVTYPCLVQPKLDGVRCLMIFHTDTSTNPSAFHTTMLSRSGKEYTTLNHIKIDIGNARMDSKITESFILDGELYSDELSFQEIVAAVKKQRPDSLKLKFRAYDIVNDENQADRWVSTFALVRDIGSEHIVAVMTTQAHDKEFIMEAHNKWVEQGYEGAMVRLMDGHYGQGQRSSHLLKVKEFDESEFAFKNFEFGQRGVEDLIAVLWDSTGTKEFRAKMQGNRKHKEELYELNDTSEGKAMTIKHFGLTTDGLPRFPIGKAFRDY